LDRIAEGYFAEYVTDQDLYTAFLQLLQDDGHITDRDVLSSFQWAFSMHSAAPRIEAQYQYYQTSIEPLLMVAQDAACPVWVHFNGKQYCSPALERAQQDFTGPEYVGSVGAYALLIDGFPGMLAISLSIAL
jgi:UDP-glucose:glycoprotein glucosyltransferase